MSDPDPSDGIAFRDVELRPPGERPWPLDPAGWVIQPKGDAGPDDRLPVCIDEQPLAAAVQYVAERRMTEAGGVLCGHHGVNAGREFVHVTTFVPAPKAKGGPAHLVFTHEAFAECEAAREALDPELQVLGWCHSHPGYGIFLSEADQFIHTQFFPLPWQVALVIDPNRSTLGIFRMREGHPRKVGFFLRSPAPPAGPDV